MGLMFRKRKKYGPIILNFTENGFSSWSIKIGRWSWNSRPRRTGSTCRVRCPGSRTSPGPRRHPGFERGAGDPPAPRSTSCGTPAACRSARPPPGWMIHVAAEPAVLAGRGSPRPGVEQAGQRPDGVGRPVDGRGEGVPAQLGDRPRAGAARSSASSSRASGPGSGSRDDVEGRPPGRPGRGSAPRRSAPTAQSASLNASRLRSERGARTRSPAAGPARRAAPVRPRRPAGSRRRRSAGRQGRCRPVASSRSAGRPPVAAVSSGRRQVARRGSTGEQRRAGRPGRLERDRQPVRVAGHEVHGHLGGQVRLDRAEPGRQVSVAVGQHQDGQPAPAQPVGELGDHPQRGLRAARVGRRRTPGRGWPAGRGAAPRAARSSSCRTSSSRRTASVGMLPFYPTGPGRGSATPAVRPGRRCPRRRGSGRRSAAARASRSSRPIRLRAASAASSSRSAGTSQTTSNSSPSGSLP